VFPGAAAEFGDIGEEGLVCGFGRRHGFSLQAETVAADHVEQQEDDEDGAEADTGAAAGAPTAVAVIATASSEDE
jgi:hypothetical protein